MYESQIRKYELGTANPKIDTIKKIAEAFNISIDRLTGDSVSSIIQSRLEETGKSLSQVAEEANVPMSWLQNIDSFTPGEDDIFGGYSSYERITRIADALGLPGSVLRTALARQEIPVPDDLPQITAEEALGGINTYKPENTDELESIETSEKELIKKYCFISAHRKKRRHPMEKLFYPALFHKAEEGGFWISFPDIPECLTQGDDMAQAYEMAVDALGLVLTCREKERQPLPSPSDPTTIAPESNSFLAVIEFDMLAYKKRTNSRAVKKTLSIPEWLNEAAIAMDLNFSQVLQEALLSKIQTRH